MFSANELYSDSQSVTADGVSTNALNHPDGGGLLEVAVVLESLTTFTACAVWLLTKAADSGWDITDPDQVVGAVNFTAAGRKTIKGYADKAYTKLYIDVTGTPGSAVITAGPVPAGQRDNYAG